MPTKIVYWAAYGLAKDQIIGAFARRPEIDFEICSSLEEVLRAMDGAKGLVLYDQPEEIARQVVAKLNLPGNSVEILHFVSAGRDGFEAAGLPDRVKVTGPGAATATIVAEHALALTLASLRALPRSLKLTESQLWSRHEMVPHIASLEDRKVLVVGYGAIGQAVTRLFKAFGAAVTAVTRTPPAGGSDGDVLVKPLSALEEAVSQCDVLILTIALAPETAGLFDADLLAALQPGSYFVNVARGEIVDLGALEALLRSGRLAGAALDVVSPEPFPAGHSLWTAPNLIFTPHIAAAGSRAGAGRLAEAARRNLDALLEREAIG
ncbi:MULTISPECIES: NAD(P)-dependent oxidoreductase [Sphingobium]|uniref:NAD(P)-dependent oxidoreductase n=1 Tax=Sphingobium TaxID=165695 RepID=UPI00159C1B03|nr:NAD(P)-dependent oxidoreductase [Sphingobium sp. 15-1]